ncbi:MAG: DNA-processing protein DprA [Butyricicoccus sp.]
MRAIPDPPTVLYVRGRWPDFDSVPAVAVVGTRKATSYGLKVADQIGTTLARAGMITVSGMALGNDGAAHRGALKAGGLTVAVLAGGPDVCYPPQHRSLMGDILLMGAIISEYPPGTEPHGRNYHQRNRIISGLSVASVIVEASDWRSGALITARHALDQGRDVYAVPGPIDAPQSQSCNEMIAKGEAALLTSPTVLVREYSGMMPEQAVQQAFRRQTGEYPEPAARSAWEDIRRREQQAEQRRAAAAEKAKAEPKQPSVAAKPLPDGLNEDEKTIVTLVRDGVSTPEELIDRCGLAAPRVMSLVTMLEMDGILRREKGRLILGTW